MWKSPTNTPIYLALPSGHTAQVGPEPRDLPERFWDTARHADSLEVIPTKSRKPPRETLPEPPVETPVEPPADAPPTSEPPP